MPDNLTDRIKKWALDASAPADFLKIWEEIEAAATRFAEYHPTITPASHFMTRLERWINNASQESDQQTLFRLVTRIFFVGSLEFNALYSAAFNAQIMRWLIDKLNINISNLNQSALSTAINETWFCPITDSMSIAAFHHVNNIKGKDFRPDWRSLHKFGSTTQILNYMTDEGLNRLVLLEDFVGSGQQASNILTYAAQILDPMEVLAVPLIICPEGYQRFTNDAKHHHNLSVDPVLLLEDAAFIPKVPRPNEDALIPTVRALAQKLYNLLQNSAHSVYTPFGFRETGGLLVTYSNCPDNTMPLIHANSSTWYPLFPRSSRI